MISPLRFHARLTPAASDTSINTQSGGFLSLKKGRAEALPFCRRRRIGW